MNHIDKHNNLDEMLIKSGDYLMKRAVQYREQAVVTASVRRAASPRVRRVLVGTAAVATLTVTAVAGSLIGGTSSGKVEVAKAAWSTVPQTPTDDLVKQVKAKCPITNETMAAIEGTTLGTAEPSRLEPALVDVRGTTITAVYFTPTHAVLCVQFVDGSVYIRDLSMGPNDGNPGNGWEIGSIAVKVQVDGMYGEEPFTATMVVGYLPPGSDWGAYVKVDGIETVTASGNKKWERFVAWIPGDVSGVVAFVNKSTGEKRDRPFIRGPESAWQMAPVTTVPYAPSS